MTLYILNYNNYFNRQVKREASIDDYLVSAYYSDVKIDNVSFNPGDGINTTQIVNSPVLGDYAVLYDNISKKIVSRWFILDAKRTLSGQYSLSLRRDVFVDNYDAIIGSPAMINRAYLDNDDPYIFKREKYKFNQIKMSQTPLRDGTRCAWIVGYIPPEAFEQSTRIETTVGASEADADIVIDGIANWEFYNYSNLASDPVVPRYLEGEMSINLYGMTLDKVWKRKISFNQNGATNTQWIQIINGVSQMIDTRGGSSYLYEPAIDDNQRFWQIDYTNNSTECSNLLNAIRGAFSTDEYNTLFGYATGSTITQQQSQLLSTLNGKILYDSNTDLSYQIEIQHLDISGSLEDIAYNSNAYALIVENLVNAKVLPSGSIPGDQSFKFSAPAGSVYTIILNQIQAETAEVNIGPTRAHLQDAPYDMFCIPYLYQETVKFNNTTESSQITPNNTVSFGIANAISKSLGKSGLYDIQLLPYCPITGLEAVDGVIDYTNYPYYNTIESSTPGTKYSIMFWCTKSQFNKTLPYEINILNPKIESELDLYRFCSPNGSNSFDFNAAQNGGLRYIQVSCAYQPYNPYIHIKPVFGSLYGSNYDDTRGLICGGDYSLPQLTSTWADYQLSHKTSLSTFHSDVTSYTSSQGLAAQKQYMASVGTTLLSNDQYNIGNMIAAPSGIAQTSSIAPDQTVFPYIEYYTCTPEERDAFKSYIDYRSMSVERIGYLRDYIKSTPHYIAGYFIQLLGINDETGLLVEINREFSKGVYL